MKAEAVCTRSYTLHWVRCLGTFQQHSLLKPVAMKWRLVSHNVRSWTKQTSINVSLCCCNCSLSNQVSTDNSKSAGFFNFFPNQRWLNSKLQDCQSNSSFLLCLNLARCFWWARSKEWPPRCFLTNMSMLILKTVQQEQSFSLCLCLHTQSFGP